MPKFDVVVGNPPYQGRLHLDFLELAYKLRKKFIVWVHPSAWLIDKKDKIKRYGEIKKLLEKSVKEITIFNGNPIFNVVLKTPFIIEMIDKDKKDSKIEVDDRINNKKLVYNSIYEINKWGDNTIYPDLEKKIFNLLKDNLENHRNKGRGEFYVNLSPIRGVSEKKRTDKIFGKNYYTFLDRNEKIEKEKTRPIWFPFNDKNQAENFFDFLKTDWARFCLALRKNNIHLHRGELKYVPWLDWTKKWTDERFEKLINATPEEIEFVHKHIPPYYD